MHYQQRKFLFGWCTHRARGARLHHVRVANVFFFLFIIFNFFLVLGWLTFPVWGCPGLGG